MSGLVGHTMYAVLAAEAAEQRGISIVPTLREHFASYLTGAYLGCDIQVMPEAVCVDTGKEVGFGTVPIDKSPITGGAVKPWSLEHDGRHYTPREIHQLFYGRAHLVFGWFGDDAKLAVPWDHLADYCALVVRDLRQRADFTGRSLAYVFGWMVHIVGDSLIKSIRSGIKMQLLDGTYTPRNRPIQDLFTFHKIGIEERGAPWAKWFEEMAATPVEPVQPHYMRIADKNGALGGMYAAGWRPERAGLLDAVLKENRRWLKHHAADVLRDMTLTNGTEVSGNVSKATGGLTYPRMMEMAEGSGMRQTLATIAEEAASLFEKVQAH
ncbi:MAG: hypothetical protein K1X78_09235 [Verrucomicrobiaceae bacterium]|nr:hypothetical protein [Verrucomicrobiaceae bacterium]